MQIIIKNVILSTASKKQLKRIKDGLYGTALNAVECCEWIIPSDTYEYVDIREILINGIKEVLRIDSSVLVEIEYFESSMLSFSKGVYPNYEYARKYRRH